MVKRQSAQTIPSAPPCSPPQGSVPVQPGFPDPDHPFRTHRKSDAISQRILMTSGADDLGFIIRA